ncbi:hypothetical protein P8H27_07455 [Pseudomonas sp. sp1636]|uniref:hypothetical protein n=1 Tax=Pseudomonas sp. sp1636 TaxID=3036707 RepID=UPI0025A54BE2|nr:hypothetical protein [Pseudomonas sp. sp1636]MDM8348734.1 hypothetical protein [Pseudomonas sp. sp1636]
MHDLKWLAAEKKLAHRVFEAALTTELAEIMADFKARAAAITEPQEMWPLQEYLARQQREIERKYDYRYSQLLFVFGQLIREGRVQEAQLTGLSEEKLGYIQQIASL